MAPNMRWHRILLPVELSATTPRLARQAAFLGHALGAEIVLLHVMRPMSYSADMLTAVMTGGATLAEADFERALEQRVRLALDQALESELAGLSVKRVLHRGDVAPEIEQTAREENIDLIMMPTHAHGRLYRFLIGSVTAKVLHGQWPLWTDTYVECRPEYQFSVRRALCALDLSAHSAHTLTAARGVAAAFGASLTLITVTQSAETFGPGGAVVLPQWRETLQASAGAEMARLQRQQGSDLPVIIDSGSLSDALSRAVRDTQADLLIIGRLPGGHLGQNGAGYALVRESTVPVLSI
jgi:nucleotide-binding universal stress UspA family protein